MTEAAPAVLPDHVLELCCLLNYGGDLTPALFDLAEQYGAWAPKNIQAHLQLQPELTAAKEDPLQGYKYEAVEYLLYGRTPTCADITRRYDTWFFDVAVANDRAFFSCFATHRILIEKVLTYERQAAAKTDPKECAALYRQAAALLARLLEIEEPKL